MSVYFVTGATGFIGSRFVAAVLAHEDCELVYVMVRPASREKLDAQVRKWTNSEKVVVVDGDLGKEALGVDQSVLDRQPQHFVHFAASYDIAASDEENVAANVTGTRNALEFAAAVGRPIFHHVSSIAVAGDYAGVFTERDFDLGQSFLSPYHRTKFEAERLVRESGLPYRVYRPSVVVGDSVTGEIDKIDGPYYSLPLIARLAKLPSWLPLVSPDLGATNFVPVDYVVSSMVVLLHAPAADGAVYHLSSPKADSYRDFYNALAKPLASPQLRRTVAFDLTRVVGPTQGTRRATLSRRIANAAVSEMGIPPIAFALAGPPVEFDSTETGRELARLGHRAEPPPFAEYAGALVNYWKHHLDPDLVRRVDRAHPLRDKTIVITGASSGIGRALAIQVASMGAIPLLIARREAELDAVCQEISGAGGHAYSYPCDLTDGEAVASTVKSILADHGAVDFLVNNAGRSIRRSIQLSLNRFHDYERVMSINYFAVVRLTLALLPSMIERQSGHIVNVTTQAIDALPSRWSAYTASKAAVDAFGLIAGAELLSEGVTVSNVRLPLVSTPMSAPSSGVHRYVPIVSARTAADRYLVKRALIAKKPVVDAVGGRTMRLNHTFNERFARVVNNIVGYQGMGETAPDGRSHNVQPPLISAAATMVRLTWRRMATRPL